MDFRHFVVTFTGASQPLTTDKTLEVYAATVQADAANGDEFFLGGRNSVGTYVVSSSDYGIRIPAPNAAGDPAPPYPLPPWEKALQINLSKVYVIGGSGQKCTISYWAK
jgi:hypothetical protein